MKTLALLGWLLYMVPASGLSEEMYTRSYYWNQLNPVWGSDLIYNPPAPNEDPFSITRRLLKPTEIRDRIQKEFNLQLPEGSDVELILGPGFPEATIRMQSDAEDHKRLLAGLMRLGWLDYQTQMEIRWISFPANGPEAELEDDALIQRWREGGGKTIASAGATGGKAVQTQAHLSEERYKVVTREVDGNRFSLQEEINSFQHVFMASESPQNTKEGVEVDLLFSHGASNDGGNAIMRLPPDTPRIVRRVVREDQLIVTMVTVLLLVEGQSP
ncbi:MAG: hypothetical protein JJU29_05710 [Verrucomicrobia bacterium]|nr:hypothetical protein [Verrucomicrobiota bacterium]MCH8510662.1 hypothetical protein [Kiritimatiellia bacterium]